MKSIRIEGGPFTESLLQYITHELDDETLDKIEINRDVAKADNLATEPLTIAATLALTTTAIVVVARIIERWMEAQRQLVQLRIVAEGFDHSDEAGKVLAEVSKANSKVSIAYGMPKGTKAE
jgi:hypothetical protein